MIGVYLKESKNITEYFNFRRDWYFQSVMLIDTREVSGVIDTLITDVEIEPPLPEMKIIVLGKDIYDFSDVCEYTEIKKSMPIDSVRIDSKLLSTFFTPSENKSLWDYVVIDENENSLKEEELDYSSYSDLSDNSTQRTLTLAEEVKRLIAQREEDARRKQEEEDEVRRLLAEEQERLAREEQERLVKEREEKERIAEIEKERLQREREERERIAQLERERLEREQEEKNRIAEEERQRIMAEEQRILEEQRQALEEETRKAKLEAEQKRLQAEAELERARIQTEAELQTEQLRLKAEEDRLKAEAEKQKLSARTNAIKNGVIGVLDYIDGVLTPPVLNGFLSNLNTRSSGLSIGRRNSNSARTGKVFVVAGATTGSGSTTFATNLAYSIAGKTRDKVLLIDLDFNNPQLTKSLCNNNTVDCDIIMPFKYESRMYFDNLDRYVAHVDIRSRGVDVITAKNNLCMTGKNRDLLNSYDFNNLIKVYSSKYANVIIDLGTFNRIEQYQRSLWHSGNYSIICYNSQDTRILSEGVRNTVTLSNLGIGVLSKAPHNINYGLINKKLKNLIGIVPNKTDNDMYENSGATDNHWKSIFSALWR